MKRVRWWAGTAGVVALLAAIVVPPAGAAPPESRERVVLNDVHTDAVHVEYTDGALGLRTRAGSPPYTFHAPRDVIFQLKDVDTARLQVPDLPEYAFLGAPGDPVWLAPQTQDPALLFAGWDTESIPTGVLEGDAVDLSLVAVDGPGRVEVFENGPTGEPLRVFSGTDGAHRTRRQAVASHVHANWAFSALGRYELTFEVRATTAGGAPLAPARATYTWYVGGAAAADVVPAETATALAVSPESPAAGEAVTLSASVTPAAASGWVEFFAGAASLGFSPVTEGAAALTTSALGAGVQSLTARFTPAFRNDYAASTSPPVTVDVRPGAVPPTTAPVSPSPTLSSSPSSPPVGTPSASATASPSVSPSASSPVCVPVTRTSTRTTTTTAAVLGDGHADYAVRLSGGRLASQVKDGTTGRTVWRDPSDVVVHVKPAASSRVPADGFDFLAPAGSTIWQIPQTQRAGIVWLGWNTEELTAGQLRGPIRWSLDKVDGPGKVAVYLLSAFGQPQVVFNSGDGLPDRYDVPVGTHAHGNWAFTREGAYRLTFTHSATLASGATVRDTATVTVAVGATDPGPLARRTSSRVDTYTGTSCDGRLALTGTSLAGPLRLGAGLLAAGIVAVVATARVRRRQR